MRYVLVKNNIIVNIIKWSGSSPYTPPADCELYPCPDDADIGWFWNNGNPVKPPSD